MKGDYNHVLITIFVVISVGCKNKTDPPADIGGKGGTAVLKITPQHHGKNIDSFAVYIKYNSQDAASVYDDSAEVIMENSKPVATFSQLKKGKYYILGRGWDSSISDDVKGGMPQTITEERTYEITLSVTEE